MPLAVTHILVPAIILEYLKKHSKQFKKMSLHVILIGGIFGLLPDVDVVAEILSIGLTGDVAGVHRMFTHSLMIPLVIALISLALWKNKKLFTLGAAAALGWAVHVLLDFLVVGKVALAFPLSAGMWGLSLLVPPDIGIQASLYLLSALDAIVFLIWLWHEEKYRKIKHFF